MNLDITKHDHFKLYILSEDRFTFESELQNHEIEFYTNSEEQVHSSHSIRYYLKDADRVKIDNIISKNEISSGLESTGLNKFEYNNKLIVRLILIIIGIVALILIIDSII